MRRDVWLWSIPARRRSRHFGVNACPNWATISSCAPAFLGYRRRDVVATNAQIDRISQRIDALPRPSQVGPHIGVVFQMPGQTVDDAQAAHAELHPEDNVETMIVVGWEPMTRAEWAAKYCASTVQG